MKCPEKTGLIKRLGLLTDVYCISDGYRSHLAWAAPSQSHLLNFCPISDISPREPQEEEGVHGLFGAQDGGFARGVEPVQEQVCSCRDPKQRPHRPSQETTGPIGRQSGPQQQSGQSSAPSSAQSGRSYGEFIAGYLQQVYKWCQLLFTPHWNEQKLLSLSCSARLSCDCFSLLFSCLATNNIKVERWNISTYCLG